MRDLSLWRALLGVEKTVIEDVEFDADEDCVVVRVRPTARNRSRCGRCLRRCRIYDSGRGRRRWRALDLGTVMAFVEADSPRVSCPTHGVVVAHVPWARHDAGHTLSFDQTVAWLATQTSKKAATELMRIAWRTVGSIIARVWADTGGLVDQFAGLTRIGIDEVSYRRGHLFLTVVVDHDTGRLVWAGKGQSKANAAAVLRCPGPRPVCSDHPCLGGLGQVHRRYRRRQLSRRGPGRRSLPRRAVGQRRARRAAFAGVAR